MVYDLKLWDKMQRDENNNTWDDSKAMRSRGHESSIHGRCEVSGGSLAIETAISMADTGKKGAVFLGSGPALPLSQQ